MRGMTQVLHITPDMQDWDAGQNSGLGCGMRFRNGMWDTTQDWDAGQGSRLGCRIGMWDMNWEWDVGLGCRAQCA